MSKDMSEDETRRLEELWTRFVARESLAKEERATLAAALERDEPLRRRMIGDLQLDGALRAAGDIEHGQEDVVAAVTALVTAAGKTEEVVAAVRRRLEEKARAAARSPAVLARRGGRTARFVAAAVLLAGGAAALALLLPGRDDARTLAPMTAENEPAAPLVPPEGAEGDRRSPAPARMGSTTAAGPGPRATVARLEVIEGRAYQHGADGRQRAAPALALAAGDWVSISGPTARARLAGPGGSRVDLAGEVVAGLAGDPAQPEGARLFLAHGRATATVPPSAARGPILVLASPHAIISGAGTVHLEVGTAVTRVEVRAGRARVSALGVQHATEIQAGQFTLVRADDLQPPRAQATPRLALLLVGPDDTKEGPPPAQGLRGSEERLKARLERLGFQVDVVDAGALSPDRARAAALMVLSPSVSSNRLDLRFAELPVPMLVLESTGFEQLGLTGARWKRDLGSAPPLSEIVIEDPAHPLAAGLSGTVKVLATPLNLRWAAPPASASLIARYAGAPDQAGLLFGYERGAATALGIAAARRVGLFLGNGRVIRALTEQGWRLFDAAVLWCAGG